VPSVVSNNRGDLSLWVGMGTSNGDLIQSIAEKIQSQGWTAYAYTLKSTGRELIYHDTSPTYTNDTDIQSSSQRAVPYPGEGRQRQPRGQDNDAL
jgi:hypothetical protein